MDKKSRYSTQTFILQRFSATTLPSGFALPIALMLGVLTVGIGLAMILRSQSDQVTAGSQQQSLRSDWIVEAGLAQTLALLQRPEYRTFLTHSYDPISPITQQAFLGPNGIPNDFDESSVALNEWQSLPTSGANPCQHPASVEALTAPVEFNGGQYRLLAYRYRDPDQIPNSGDETGQVLVEGQRQQARGRRWVSFPIVSANQADQILFPGVFAQQVRWGKGQLLARSGESGRNANLICTDCQFQRTPETAGDKLSLSSLCSDGSPTQVALRTAIGANAEAQIQGEIHIQTQTLLPMPALPPQPCGGESGANCAVSLPVIQDSLTLPTPTEVAISSTWPAGQPIRYRTPEMNLSNGAALTLNATTLHPIYLYVTGNISLDGTDTRIQNLGNLTRFHLYGNPRDPGDQVPDQEFAIANAAAVENVLIYAPDARLQLSGPAQTPNLIGAAWVKTFEGREQTQIQVPDVFSADPVILNFLSPLTQFTTLGPIRIWQQQPLEVRTPTPAATTNAPADSITGE